MEHLLIDLAKITFIIIGAAIFTSAIISFGSGHPAGPDEFGPGLPYYDEDDE